MTLTVNCAKENVDKEQDTGSKCTMALSSQEFVPSLEFPEIPCHSINRYGVQQLLGSKWSKVQPQ